MREYYFLFLTKIINAFVKNVIPLLNGYVPKPISLSSNLPQAQPAYQRSPMSRT